MSERIEMRSPVGVGTARVPAPRVGEMKARGWAPVVAPASEGSSRPLSQRNKTELTETATEMGLTVDESMTKSELLDLIRAAE